MNLASVFVPFVPFSCALFVPWSSWNRLGGREKRRNSPVFEHSALRTKKARQSEPKTLILFLLRWFRGQDLVLARAVRRCSPFELKALPRSAFFTLSAFMV